MRNTALRELYRAASAGRLSRRDVLRRAAALGLSTATVSALLVACGGTDAPTAPGTNGASIPSTPNGSAGASTAGAGAKNAPTGGTIVVANYAMPVTLDPGRAPGFQNWFPLQNVCEALVEIVATPDGKISINPVLAEGYDRSADGITWTFRLHRGVKFHDGTPFNAQAVVFSHDRLMKPDDPHYDPIFAPLGQPLNTIIGKVEAVDDATVRFTLKSPPNPYFLNWEAFTRIVSPAAVDKYGKGFGTQIVGTGPFRLDKFDATGKSIEMSKNPDYWVAGLPKVDKLVWKAVDESSTRLALLETGDADVATLVPPNLADRVKSNPKLVLQAANVPNFNMIEFYRTVPPFDNLKLRQAVAYALDRKALAATLYGGYWKAATNNRWPNMPGWEETQPYPYDPEKAKALLREAGFPNGLQITLDMPSSSSGNPADQRWGEAIQAQLAAVGITAKLNVLDNGAYFNFITKPRENNAHYMTRQVFVGDVVNEWLTYWIKPLPNTSQDVAVPGLDQLSGQLQTTGDPAQYTDIVTRMWRVIDDQVPYVAIADGSWLTGTRQVLKGIEPRGLGEYFSFKNAYLER